ncbi:hypothetical protein N9B82_04460 [Saprospiraceae bacterium]|nr:hypothetical protein [Saprospiraceae bacterium]
MKERIAIIEERSYGLIVLNITKKVKQFIPMEKYIKRVNWGIYEIVNACLLPTASMSMVKA